VTAKLSSRDAHNGQVAEEEAAQDEEADPNQRADCVEEQEATIGHGRHAGYEGQHGANPGDETGHNNGRPAASGQVTLGSVHVSRLGKR
jgi:hypothetical protein